MVCILLTLSFHSVASPAVYNAMHDAEDTGSQSGLIVIQKYCRVNPPGPAGQSTLSTLHAAIVKCSVFAAWQTLLT